MFRHRGALEHVLPPAAYHEASWWERERERLFARQWHFAATEADLARVGDTVAREVMGVPVFVRRTAAGPRAFLNVCAHRHARLVSPGHARLDVVRCPYHGWGYGDDGRVREIPDARSFRGMRGAPALRELALERLGGLVFVNTAPEPEPLRASLGELAAEIDRFYGRHRVVWRWETVHDVNWKVIAENAVESYHVPVAHPGTFQDFRSEDLHEHRIEKAWTRYHDRKPWGSRGSERAMLAAGRWLLPGVPVRRFTQAHAFPHHLFYHAELFSSFVALEPLGPRRTRHVQLGLVPRELPPPAARLVLQAVFARVLVAGVRRVMREDMRLWPRIQAGLEHSPHAGVLSAREERVHRFQQYVAEAVGLEAVPGRGDGG